MEMKNNKIPKAKRALAYMMDSIAISTICWVAALLMRSSELKLFSLAHIMHGMFSIAVACVYYIYFWHYSDYKATLGQKILGLEINGKASMKQCRKRLLFMNIGGIFFCGVLLYAHIAGTDLNVHSIFLLIAMICTVAMQLIYPVFIERVDAVTGIKVQERV
jgi:uncharacterized membrane protein